MQQRPFIKKFEGYSGKKYIYCANTNRILEVENIVYDVIDYINVERDEAVINRFNKRYSTDDIRIALNELRTFNQKMGFASIKKPRTMEIGLNKDEYENKLHNGLWGINLNLTNDCNLKCRYCLYNKSFYYKRKIAPRYMSPIVAKNAIEYFIKYSSGEKELHLGYYGGEPFMNYDVMKGSLELLKTLNKKRNDKKLHIHVTSNCTLLNNEKIKWLIENDIKILVSLDGPKNIHDRYRIQKNDKGTFDLVLKALKTIRTMSHDYYDKHVSMNMVLAPPYDLDALSEFVVNNQYVQNKILPSVLLPDKNGCFANIANESKMTFHEFQNNVFNDYFKRVRNDIKHIYKYASLLSLSKIPFHSLAGRGYYDNSEDVITIPMCEMGVGRGFILTDGSFYPCERISQHIYLELGNIYDGMYKGNHNATKAWNIIEDYFHILDNRCCDCWAFRMCAIKTCIKYASSAHKLSNSKLTNHCHMMKNYIANNLKCYLDAGEKFPDIMKGLLNTA